METESINAVQNLQDHIKAISELFPFGESQQTLVQRFKKNLNIDLVKQKLSEK